MAVTSEEKINFLKRQGWKEDLPPDEKNLIESAWTEADIEMATEMGF